MRSLFFKKQLSLPPPGTVLVRGSTYAFVVAYFHRPPNGLALAGSPGAWYYGNQYRYLGKFSSVTGTPLEVVCRISFQQHHVGYVTSSSLHHLITLTSSLSGDFLVIAAQLHRRALSLDAVVGNGGHSGGAELFLSLCFCSTRLGFPRRHDKLHFYRAAATRMKLGYLFVRYFGLLSQLVNYVMAQQIFSRLPVSRSACAGWYAFGLVAFWALYAPCDLLLMSRVYELYDQSPRVALFLVSLHLVETLVVSVCSWYSLRALRFDSLCKGSKVPDGVIIIVIMLIASQIILWTMVARKKMFWKGFNRETLKLLSEKHDRWPWFLVFASLPMLIPVALTFQFVLPHIFFSWPSTMLSVGVRSHTRFHFLFAPC
ncbi:hypothetical protein CVT26_008703 [Gymnopilus dilepis]|uniref:Uncharacterized protein n=1 Tax=Gymnopilus dilepis TaxID=231916 RepID=A0A409W9I7_9AGAR|nr:hypothetical protein CVT26_008703 [Gymnopilus dilepis]